MSKFEIHCDNVVVGFTDFEFADEMMGFLTGRFVPASDYTRIQHYFAQEPQTAEALELPLSVFHAGKRVPTIGVYIQDFSAYLGTATGIEVIARFSDSEAFKNLVDSNNAEPDS